MKKGYIFFNILILLANMVFPQNQQVSIGEAETAAVNWVQANYPACRSSHNIALYTNMNGDTLLYEIMFDSVTLLMSGSKACLPILGSYHNGESVILNIETLPCNFRNFINSYLAEINYCFAKDTIKLYHNLEWECLESGRISNYGRSSDIVSPLISTKWGQSYSNNYPGNYPGDPYAYNYYIQSGDNCQHCLVGCGAVAMAQIMNYWQYPVVCIAPKQIDWCNMSNGLFFGTDEYETKRNAVAYLMYRCAKDINSVFQCDSTLSNFEMTRNALVEKYGYSNSAVHIKRRSYSGNWADLIRYNLDRKLPVLYRGDGTGGHAFVCEGYKDDGRFYFNWGWRGYYDGAYALSSLTPNIDTFTNNQAAIVYIKPSHEISICNAILYLQDFYYLFYDVFSNSGIQPYDVTPSTMTMLVSASASSPLSWRTIPTGETAVYQAHEEIVLRDGFTAEYGSDFTAKIVKCPNCEENRNNEEDYSVESGGEQPVDMAPAHIGNVVATGPQQADIYPNPTDGELTMAIDGDVEAVVILDINGNPQGGWDMLSFNEERITLNVRRLKAGAYLLTVRHPGGRVESARFIKQ